MKIKFYPESKLVEEIIPMPQPSQVPLWFKNMPLYEYGATSFNAENGTGNYTGKICIPFTDSFLTGYTFNTWADIQVKIINGQQIITWGHTFKDLEEVTARIPAVDLPIYENFSNYNFSWISHWGIKTPKGYSCIFTHPLNRQDLPFITTTGIMDTDGWGIWGNQPFALRKDFEGIIEAGTPIIQVIPFKREEWQSEKDNSLTEWANLENMRRASKFRGYYKKYWKRKIFN